MTSSSAASAVLAGLEGTRVWQEDVYRDLHQRPELSHQEERTARVEAERLGDAGYHVHPGVGGTGVVAVLSNGTGPRVLLRADMDTLPVREQTGLDDASSETATDQDGQEVPETHACGHDTHVPCPLGAAACSRVRPTRGAARPSWYSSRLRSSGPATSRTSSTCPTPPGASVASTRRPTGRPAGRDGSPRTSR